MIYIWFIMPQNIGPQDPPNIVATNPTAIKAVATD